MVIHCSIECPTMLVHICKVIKVLNFSSLKVLKCNTSIQYSAICSSLLAYCSSFHLQSCDTPERERLYWSIARQFHIPFALYRAFTIVTLNAHCAFPVAIAGGLIDNQFLVFQFGLEDKRGLQLWAVNSKLPAGGIVRARNCAF